MEIKPVKWIDEVLEIALESMPKPLSDEEFLAGTESKGSNTKLEDGKEEDDSRVNTH